MPEQYDEIAAIYARSLYELADEAGKLDKVGDIYDELLAIVEMTRADANLREFFSSPIIGVGRRSESLHTIFDGRISDMLLRFLLVANEKGRLGHLEQIVGAYDAIVQEAHGRIEVDLITASDEIVGSELIESVKKRVHDVLGKEPVLHHYTDPSMIGGIKLRIGDQLVDGSVATRLRRMKEEILGEGAVDMRADTRRFLDDDKNQGNNETTNRG